MTIAVSSLGGTAGPKSQAVKIAKEFELAVIAMGVALAQLQMQAPCLSRY